MNVKTVSSAALTFFLAMAVAASPSEHTSEDLLNDCHLVGESTDSAQSHRCIYYIRGFLDSKYRCRRPNQDKIVHLPFGSRAGRIPSGRLARDCIDEKMTAEEIIEVLLEFARNVPDEPTPTAAALLQRLLAEHYECGRNARE